MELLSYENHRIAVVLSRHVWEKWDDGEEEEGVGQL